MKIGSTEIEWRNVKAGVIQGSVIGPFILFISGINQFIPAGVELEKYADETSKTTTPSALNKSITTQPIPTLTQKY